MSGRSSSLQPLFSKSFALDLYKACLYIHIHTTCQSLGHVRRNSNTGRRGEGPRRANQLFVHICALQSDRRHNLRLTDERYIGKSVTELSLWWHRYNWVLLTQSSDLASTLSGTDNRSLCGTKREGETSGSNRERGPVPLLEVLRQPCDEDLMHQRSGERVRRYQPRKRASPAGTTRRFTWLILLFSLASWYLGSSVVTVYLSLFFS